MITTTTPEAITIIGGGLAGSLLALVLARRGYTVDVYEKRPDYRQHPPERGRSINLALSTRGIAALEAVGLGDVLTAEALPMYGRAIHAPDGGVVVTPYGPSEAYYINSVSRWRLNERLLEACRALPNVRVHFGHACVGIDLQTRHIRFDTGAPAPLTVPYRQVLAADGAGSVLRKALAAHIPGFRNEEHPLGHSYQEFALPPTATGDFALSPNALHIWPRGAFMLIALPNPDRTFTCTLFLADTGPDSFEALARHQDFEAFFSHHFPDAWALIPDAAHQHRHNPIGYLGTVRCTPWHLEDEILLLGDAAHAIVPFYGQGMNCAFEDCRVFDQLLDQFPGLSPELFATFDAQRKPNGDAIAQLALENFEEMKHRTADPVFQHKRWIELELEKRSAGRYHSKYSLVTFTHLPYAEAHRIGNALDDYLLDIARTHPTREELDLEALLPQAQARYEALLADTKHRTS
jgi:kynurenine 3-monooxygenase